MELSLTIPMIFKAKKPKKLLIRLKKIIEYQGVSINLFLDVADSFIAYIHSLDVDEIQQLDDDLKANGCGTKSLIEIENTYELLTIF